MKRLGHLNSAVGMNSAIMPQLVTTLSKEVAQFLKVGPHQVTERYALSEGFPKPIRLPSVADVRGVPRWRAMEVVQWSEKHREGSPTSRGGRPRQAA